MVVEKERSGRACRARDKAAIAVICLAVLLCELFVMNYKHWESLLYRPVEGAVRHYEVCGEEAVVEFSEIHEPVTYLAFRLEPEQQAEITVAAVDEANSAYLYAPSRVVRGDVPRSQYLRLHFSGDVYQLKVMIRGMRGEAIREGGLNTVVLNATVPLFFSWQRYLILTAGICCLYLLRPSSRCYEVWTDLTKRRQWIFTAVCIAIQLLFLGRMLRWNTGALAWPDYMEHHQQYYRLAESLLEGRTDVGEAPALQALDNPYDPSARAAAGIGYENFKWDHAYYNGRYYVYFGIVPVLMFYLPYYALTGVHLPHMHVIFILGGLLMAGCAYLLWQMIRRWFPHTPYILYLLLTVTMGAASCLGYAVYKPDLYLVPVLSGIVCGVWGLAFWISAVREDGYCAWRLGAGSLCIALIAGCRPQMLLILAMAPVLFGRAILRERRLFSRRGMAQTLALCLPFGVVAAGIMWYNGLRFGAVWDFGASYNLTTNDMTHRGWVWGRCGLGIFSYLLQPPRIGGVFPFLQDFRVETVYQGLTLSEMMVGGALWLFPVLCFGLWGLRKREIFVEQCCYRLVWVSQLAMVALAVVDAQMAGLLTRYFGDFVWMGMIGSVLVILSWQDMRVRTGGSSRILRGLVVAACCATLTFAFLRIFAHSEDSIQSANPALFYQVRSLIAFWM
ncbi:MAG: hypothetical protein NC543_00910 [bacterium]|nr:hypothetical protein [bacterium]MCM1375020.1 hypothetical protein [Muribaculum sp.]